MVFEIYNKILLIGLVQQYRKFIRRFFGSAILFSLKNLFPAPKISHDFQALFSKIDGYSNKKLNLVALNIAKGNYSFLGISIRSKPLPNWHKDYVSKYCWAEILYNKVRKYTPKSSDVKYPWELSTLVHLFPVAVLYKKNKDEKLLKFYISQLNHWIKFNPYPYGINWANPMSVSIRLILLIETLFLFIKDIPAKDMIKIHNCIWNHLLFLVNNLENLGHSPANHYLFDIAGILWGSLYFSQGNPLIRLIRKWAIATIEQEMERQTLPDGMNFEGSTSYHRFVTELLTYSAILINKNGERVSLSYLQRLRLMMQTLQHFTLPNGLYPHIGDNDDGRIFYGSDYYSWSRRDANYILAVGAILFDEPGFLSQGKKSHELSEWIFGKKELDRLAKIKGLSDTNSFELSHSQFYFSKKDRDCLIINCSRPRHPEFGHTHNDTLSFVLCLNGEEVFVDPGSYIYTRSKRMRNLFRSVQYHNTVQVDREEQWILPDNDLFFIPKGIPPKVLKWESSDVEDIFVGEHYGYTRLSGGIVHQRKFKILKMKFMITLRDYIYAQRQGERKNEILRLRTRFYLSEKVSARIDENEVLIYRKDDSQPICIMRFATEKEISLFVEDAWFSPAYGVKISSKVLVFETFAKPPCSFKYQIEKLHNFQSIKK